MANPRPNGLSNVAHTAPDVPDVPDLPVLITERDFLDVFRDRIGIYALGPLRILCRLVRTHAADVYRLIPTFQADLEWTNEFAGILVDGLPSIEWHLVSDDIESRLNNHQRSLRVAQSAIANNELATTTRIAVVTMIVILQADITPGLALELLRTRNFEEIRALMARAAPITERSVPFVQGFGTTEAERQRQQQERRRSLVRPAAAVSSPPVPQRPCTRASPTHPATGALVLESTGTPSGTIGSGTLGSGTLGSGTGTGTGTGTTDTGGAILCSPVSSPARSPIQMRPRVGLGLGLGLGMGLGLGRGRGQLPPRNLFAEHRAPGTPVQPGSVQPGSVQPGSVQPGPQRLGLVAIREHLQRCVVPPSRARGQPFVPPEGIADPATGHPNTASWANVVIFGHAIGEGDRLAELPTAADPIMRDAGFTFEELLPIVRDLLTSGIVPILNTDLHPSAFYITAALQDRLMDALRVMGRLEPMETWIGRLAAAEFERMSTISTLVPEQLVPEQLVTEQPPLITPEGGMPPPATPGAPIAPRPAPATSLEVLRAGGLREAAAPDATAAGSLSGWGFLVSGGTPAADQTPRSDPVPQEAREPEVPREPEEALPPIMHLLMTNIETLVHTSLVAESPVVLEQLLAAINDASVYVQHQLMQAVVGSATAQHAARLSELEAIVRRLVPQSPVQVQEPVPVQEPEPITPPAAAAPVAPAGCTHQSPGACSLCLSPLHGIVGSRTSNLVMLRRCGHVFCGTCLHQSRQYGPNRCPNCRTGYYGADIVTLQPDYTVDGGAIICAGCHVPQPVPPSVVSAMPCGHIFCANCTAARQDPRSVCDARTRRPDGTVLVCGRMGVACRARLG